MLPLLTVAGVLSGCTARIGITRFDPPVFAFPEEATQVALIDQTITPSGAAAIAALAEGLSGERGLPAIAPEVGQDAYLEVRSPKKSKFTPEVAAHVCERTGARAIVTLQGFKLWDIQGSGYVVQSMGGDVSLMAMPGAVAKPLDYDYVGPATTQTASIERILSSTWRTYGCDGRILDTRRFADSASDVAWGSNKVQATATLAAAAEPAHVAAGRMGHAMAALLVPSTVVTERTFYPGLTPQMGDAATYAWEGNWEEAARVWGSITEDKAKRQAQVLVNLSVAAEAQGDIAGARDYAAKAHALAPSKVTQNRVDEAEALTPDTVPAPKPPAPPAESDTEQGADAPADGDEAPAEGDEAPAEGAEGAAE